MCTRREEYVRIRAFNTGIPGSRNTVITDLIWSFFKTGVNAHINLTDVDVRDVLGEMAREKGPCIVHTMGRKLLRPRRVQIPIESLHFGQNIRARRNNSAVYRLQLRQMTFLRFPVLLMS